jgi:hypothetical protein
VALHERRNDDAEQILTELAADHGNDPRVLQLWVREAVRRGWAREAEDGMTRLAALLPLSRSVAELRLAALDALDRHEERQLLLEELLGDEKWEPRLVEELTSGCLIDEAVMTLQRLRDRFDDPRVDVSLIRLALGSGEIDRARSELASARGRWGDLQVLDQLAILVEAHDDSGLEAALGDALDRDPANLQLRTLSWRRGAEPFFESFRVDLDEVLDEERSPTDDIDLVLLLDQAVEELFEDGSSLYYYHGVSRAITPVGARQASLLQPLADAYWLRVRVIKADGRIVVPTDLDTAEGVVELEDVKPGDLVEEEYVARIGPSDTFPGGHLSPYVYRFADVERAFGRSEYQLIVPPGVDLKVEGNFSGLERKEWLDGERRIVRWRAERMPPIAPEPLSPPNQDLLPWVSYGFGVSWQQVGDAFRDRALKVLETTVELRRWGEANLIGGDPLEVVRHLVAAVFDEVEEGRTILSLSSTAGESFSRRSGNRLGIVASVLVQNGWDLSLVLARPSPFAGRNLGVPTLDAFTEPILVARRDDVEVWIDLEEQRRSVDHIRPMLQGGDGLVMPLSRPDDAVTILNPLPSFPNPELEQVVRVAASIEAFARSRGGAAAAAGGGRSGRTSESDLRAAGREYLPRRPRCPWLSVHGRRGHGDAAVLEAAKRLRARKRRYRLPQPGHCSTAGADLGLAARAQLPAGVAAADSASPRTRADAARWLVHRAAGASTADALGIGRRGASHRRESAAFGAPPGDSGQDRDAGGVSRVRSLLPRGRRAEFEATPSTPTALSADSRVWWPDDGAQPRPPRLRPTR